MIKFSVIATLIIVAISPLTSYANELQVDYKTFYSHVRKLSGEDTQALQFAFGFMNIHTNQLCTINEARISTQKVQMPITVTPENRFTIPKEKALRLADAKVILNLKFERENFDIWLQNHNINSSKAFGTKITFERMQQAAGLLISAFGIAFYTLLQDIMSNVYDA